MVESVEVYEDSAKKRYSVFKNNNNNACESRSEGRDNHRYFYSNIYGVTESLGPHKQGQPGCPGQNLIRGPRGQRRINK